MADSVINARELSALRRNYNFTRYYLLLDIRKQAEYEKGCIPGAVNFPYEQLPRALRMLPYGKRIIVYCDTGINSGEAADFLREKGYTVFELHGGYAAWLAVCAEM